MKSSFTGRLGEEIGLIFLEKKGYKLVEKNYSKPPFGEIDLIVKKEKVIYFVEVKSTTSKKQDNLIKHLDKRKIKKFKRISEIYLKDKKILKIKIRFLALFVCYIYRHLAVF